MADDELPDPELPDLPRLATEAMAGRVVTEIARYQWPTMFESGERLPEPSRLVALDDQVRTWWHLTGHPDAYTLLTAVKRLRDFVATPPTERDGFELIMQAATMLAGEWRIPNKTPTEQETQ